MPLKDVQDLGRLMRLGSIRLGWQEPSRSGNSQKPVASDHFVMKDASFLVPHVGEEPTELKIHFPYPGFDDNISADYRVWVGGATGHGIDVCRGDGECVQSALPFTVKEDKDPDGNDRVRVYRDKGDRKVSYGRAAVDFRWGDRTFKVGDTVPCPGKEKDLYPHCAACSPSIILKVMIRKPVEAARWGYWQISTKSLNNYRHFLAVWASITNGGKLPIPMNDIPFVLRIAPGETLFQNAKDKSWGSREAFFLQLEVEPDVAQLIAGARERRIVAMLEGRQDPMFVPQLTAIVPNVPFEAEDPAPPPWAEVGDEPDEAQFEEIEPEAAQPSQGEFTDKAPELDYVPEGIDTWGDRRWGRLYFEARNHLGFQDDAHVQRVLDRLYPEAEDKERMTYKGAWTLLVGYRRSALEDEAATGQ